MIKKIKNYIVGLWSKLNDPTRRLERQYDKLLLEARNLQRGGDIPAFAGKMREADDVRKKIEELTG
jgi:hypothetical protein